MPRLRVISQKSSFSGQIALVRIDTDVEIKNRRVVNTKRLTASLPTIDYIVKRNGIVVLLGHLKRPGGKVVQDLTLEPIARWFADHYKGKIKARPFVDIPGWEITDQIALLENLRFFKGEESPGTREGNRFAHLLARLGTMYVNDAFAVCHRKNVSIVSLPILLPHFAGLNVAQEVDVLSTVMTQPKRPLVVVVGGSKMETKLPLVEKMHEVADYVLVGGKIAEDEKTLLIIQHEKGSKKSILLVADLSPDGLDITDKSAENFIEIVERAKTIIWNGPLGKLGNAAHEKNTKKVADAIVKSGVYTVIGGGDTALFLEKYHMLEKMDFVSNGGGAMLEFLAGKNLPGLTPLYV